MTLSAKMHTGKSSIYLPCLSYETAKVHVISVKGQVLLQSLVNTKDIKLPYFLCFNFLDDTGEVSYISDRNLEEFRCHLLFFNRNSWRILMTNVVFLSKILEEFWWHIICWLMSTFSLRILEKFWRHLLFFQQAFLKNSAAICFYPTGILEKLLWHFVY